MLVETPHFQATDSDELVFLRSDSHNGYFPVNTLEPEEEEEEGTLQEKYYMRIPLDHADSRRWRTEIGTYLAPLVCKPLAQSKIGLTGSTEQDTSTIVRTASKLHICTQRRGHSPTLSL